MKKLMMNPTLLLALGVAVGATGCISMSKTTTNTDAQIISQQDATAIALKEVKGDDVIGIRFDKPDTQWDVFVKAGEQGYEVEVDAVSGKVVTAEKESLAEIQAELSGDLSHEGVFGDVDK